MTNLLKNPVSFFIIAVLLVVFAWQANRIFHVSGDTDNFNRVFAGIPLIAWCVLKARTMKW